MSRGRRPEKILIGAPRNHTAADCYGFPDQSGRTGAAVKYNNDVCTGLGDAINEAVDNLQPARARIAAGKDRLQLLC